MKRYTVIFLNIKKNSNMATKESSAFWEKRQLQADQER